MSALVKPALAEPEAAALDAELDRWEGEASSALASVEAVRACARVGPPQVGAVRERLLRLSLIPMDDDVLDRAARLEPRSLRSLDSIYLATALSLGGDLGVFIAYDRRLLDAAIAAGLPTASPGA